MDSMVGWRIFAYIFILLYLISSVTILFLGSYLLLFYNNLPSEFADIKIPFWSCFGVVALLSLVTLVKWKGTVKGSTATLKYSSFLLLLTVAGEIALSVWCFLSSQNAAENMTSLLEHSFAERSAEESRWWNNMQQELQCCGLKGPHDYYFKAHIPLSCCGKQNRTDGALCSLIYQHGCVPAFAESLGNHFQLVFKFLIIFAILQVPGLFFSWCLGNKFASARYCKDSSHGDSKIPLTKENKTNEDKKLSHV